MLSQQIWSCAIGGGDGPRLCLHIAHSTLPHEWAWLDLGDAQPYLFLAFSRVPIFVGGVYPQEKFDGGSNEGLIGVMFRMLSPIRRNIFSRFTKRHDARP